MAEQEIVLEGELSKPEPKKKKKWPRWVEITVDIAMVTLVAMSLFVATNIVFLRTNYNSSFYVNGMSMYPTLNAHTLDEDGNERFWFSGSSRPGQQVEYGYAKIGDKDNWRDSLQRYDVVVTYYPSDYYTNTAGEKVLLSTARSKIKRLIGFPGETVHFDPVEEDTEFYNRAWGKTTINPGQENEQILKPLYTMVDFPTINGRTYDYPTDSGTYGHITLKENEYFVMGDNRGKNRSSDSRSIGPITGDMILGKAYLIVGKRTLDNQGEPMDEYSYAFSPWNYRRIR